jgi:hypothetical protein
MKLFKSIMTSFHTRNNTPANEMIQGEEAAKKQEVIILNFFMQRKDERFTPFEVQQAVGKDWEITSVRRAITNLTTSGRLIKDDKIRKPGLKGKSNCTWSYAV